MRILVLAVALGLSAPAFAAKSQPGALNRCATLLPEGKDYTLKVDGTLRRDGKKTTVKRTVTVEGMQTVVPPKGVTPPTDSREDAEAFRQEIDAFQKCLDEHL